MTYISNMWDTYFEGGRDHRLDRLSITQLPYYDGARLAARAPLAAWGPAGCACRSRRRRSPAQALL